MQMQPWHLAPWVEVDMVIRLIVAALLSSVVGWERELAAKPAGFRTLGLVGLGSALFAILSAEAFPGISDPTRIAAGIVTGIGFLGAGTIIRTGTAVRGLTTAASIWSVAAIGVAAAFGFYPIAIAGALLSLLILHLPHKLRPGGNHRHEDR
ncbi:MAG: MgtC/SapB family protein [Dehalococcoidia bacterium]|nr:MgtC/SapB family protein [Dehalococcoidia bacterium]